MVLVLSALKQEGHGLIAIVNFHRLETWSIKIIRLIRLTLY